MKPLRSVAWFEFSVMVRKAPDDGPSRQAEAQAVFLYA
jgi:hypothetical protein